MSIERLHAGKHMSQIVIHDKTVYLSGQIADDPTLDIGKQTQQVLKKIDHLLKEAGSCRSRILSATVWLTDIRHFAEMNQIWDGWIDPDNPPARATVQALLAQPGYLIEIMIVATHE
ncbi:RidA family protein [Magnetococcales bacterium HHB-1]